MAQHTPHAIDQIVTTCPGCQSQLSTELRLERGKGFDQGMQLGARVEHEVAVRALATALLEVLGKDPGDGPIDLGAAGVWFAGSGDHAQAERVG